MNIPEIGALKNRIKHGEIVIGVSALLDSDRGRLEDILGKDAYDFLTVDSQHSPFNEERLVSFCTLAEDTGMPAQFRINNTRYAYQIGNILDLDPATIEVPLLEEESVVD